MLPFAGEYPPTAQFACEVMWPIHLNMDGYGNILGDYRMVSVKDVQPWQPEYSAEHTEQ